MDAELKKQLDIQMAQYGCSAYNPKTMEFIDVTQIRKTINGKFANIKGDIINCIYYTEKIADHYPIPVIAVE